jgi:hypothetical protein
MNQPQDSYASLSYAGCAEVGSRAVSAGYLVTCEVCGGKGNVVPRFCQQFGGNARLSEREPSPICTNTGWLRVPPLEFEDYLPSLGRK